MAGSNHDWLRTSLHRLAYDCHFPDSHPDFLSRLDPEYTAATIADSGVLMLLLCAKSHW